MCATVDHLGIGIYSPAEAAFYARVSTKLMTRWVIGDSDGKPVIDRELRGEAEKTVTFLDLIQALAIRAVRQRHGLSLQKIRQGIEAARTKYGLAYPLAHNHRIFLYSDRLGAGHGEMLIFMPDDDSYIQLTGSRRGNLMLRKVVEMFLDDLTFDASGLATQYRPMEYKGASVLLDPHRRFGEPVIEPGGYTAETLYHATNAEGGFEAAASAYGVGVFEVVLANKYYDHLLADATA